MNFYNHTKMTTIKSQILFLLVIPLFLFLTDYSAKAGTVNFTVSPSVIEFDAVQGAVKVFPLSLYNQGTSPLEVRMSVHDFVLDPNGASQLVLSDGKAHHWAQYVKLDSTSFKVEPGERHTVRAVLNMPRGKLGGGYFAVVFYARPETVKKQKRRSGGIVLGARLATLFIGEISRTGSHQGRIISAEVNPGPYSAENPLSMRIMLENTGTTHIKAKGSITLRNEQGKVIDRVNLESGSGLILPDSRRYFKGFWQSAHKFPNEKVTADIRFLFPGGNVRKRLPLPLDFQK
ncbi:MAG: hypothetical protein BA867_12250 [Desulfobacterales bacterium S5133MH16]|nr:MAG: hypothetical protein BA867_12250 [Desulfobacterales bacterium S5133MH16]